MNSKKYKHKYNTSIEAGYPNRGEDTRLITNMVVKPGTPESYARDLPSGEIHKARGGLAS